MNKMYEKVERQNEKQKIVLIVIFLTGLCFLTWYWHEIYNTHTIITHLYYIPIILSSIWWGKKGFFTALFLSIYIIFSNVFLETTNTWAHIIETGDYLRIIMLLINKLNLQLC
ncbi:hypothetical protein [Desulfobacula sp.]|uniref:hypothetical protein n=1 Tax=Desulfobacula sp. TaxID=2593537 RepID=UPI0025C6128C|nr:hypothetical protein [Desulfobacula sp.]MBC2705791.1 hypothetical protein [Desulfobacula sp.]